MIWLALIGKSAAAGESFNLDFRGTFTGLPDTYGAASGQTGTWVDVLPNTPTGNLINVSGQATSVSITVTGRGDTFNPQTTIDSILLRDAIVSDFDFGEDFSVAVTGLPNGVYDVYYYYHGATSGLSLNSMPMADLAGGSADALGSEGTNWDVMRTTISGGTLTIADSTPASDGLSGIQIVFVARPELIFLDGFEEK
jgi:hypothetical protein